MPDIGAPGFRLHWMGQRVAVLALVEVESTCRAHGNVVGFPNLLSSTLEGDIIHAPHVTGARVIALDEEEATAQTDNHCGVARLG